MEKEISRRGFLRGAAITSAAVAATAAIAGCSPSSGGSQGQGASASASSDSAQAGSSWRTPPAEITDFVSEIDCDVVVCGHGFAGLTACRELAEEGKKVILVEKQPEDSYAATGNEFASLNATILKERGVPEIDPVEFYQNWMTITANYPNQDLVMKFAQNSGANSDWYLSALTEEDFATMTTAFFPKTEHQLDQLGAIKFWPSVCSFYGECNQTKIHGYNRELAKAAGAEFYFGTEAQYVIMSDGAVAGLVATNDEGAIKFNCRAVVIACGGFGANPEMCADLIPDVQGNLVGDETISSMAPRDGRGVQMAYWAGAHLETTPVPGMNFRGLSVPGKMNCLPQAVWIDADGKRFCNEFYPTSEQRGIATVFRSRKTKWAVVDDNFTLYRQYTIPQHAGFDATEANIASLRESLDTAYAKFNGTYVEEETEENAQGGAGAPAGGGEGGEGAPEGGPEGGPAGGPGGPGGGPGGPGGGPGGGGPMGAVEYIADDTLEGLADQMGMTGQVKENFLKQIAEWNEYCYQGADMQYGRNKEVLFPIDTPPYYACSFDPVLGETMVTCGGIITDGEQNALDQNFEPIPGLYVSGNDCGRRFGYEYITPIPGVSLGMAITLGRECGKSVGKFLDA